MNTDAHNIRRGFTLVELTLSMAVLTVLMGGMASALFLAGRAVPDRETPLKATSEGFHAADQLAGELFAAQALTTRSATTVEFTVPDRCPVPPIAHPDCNGTNNPEIIRYAWNSVAGGPLTRRYNNGAVENVLENVYQFELRFDTQSVGGQDKVTAVHITLRRGPDATARVDSSVQLLNQPP